MPKQARSKATVKVILEAATRVLKERGYEDFTTNHVAERAGVSIGSLYQYFPDKASLLKALYEDHSREMAEAISFVITDAVSNGLLADVRQLVRAAMAAHETDPEMHEIFEHQLPVFQEDEPVGADVYRHICALIQRNGTEIVGGAPLELKAWTVMRLTRSLVHSAILERPESVSAEEVEEEVVRCIYGYLAWTPKKDPPGGVDG